MPIKKRKKSKKPKRQTTIKVDIEVHNKFAETLKRFRNNYPICYLLGENKKNIITKIERLKNSADWENNCREMPTIIHSSLIKSYTKLIKRRVIPCGLARVGRFDAQQPSARGDSLYEVGDMGGFIISFCHTSVVVEQYKNRKKRILGYSVISKSKKKGGVKNGKN